LDRKVLQEFYAEAMRPARANALPHDIAAGLIRTSQRLRVQEITLRTASLMGTPRSFCARALDCREIAVRRHAARSRDGRLRCLKPSPILNFSLTPRQPYSGRHHSIGTAASEAHPMVSRAQRTPFADWWWTVDRPMLAALIVLMLAGIILSLAASPSVAARIGLDPFYFVHRQAMYLVPAVAVMLATSFLAPRQIRRIALVVFAIAFVMVLATPFFGAEVKGARRWIVLAGVNIQPSEFLKPAFVILIAWLFAESSKKPEMPANTLALLTLFATVTALVRQPDFGQTMLITLVWGALFFMAGMRVIWVIGLAGTAAAGLAGAYFTVPYVMRRIQRFLDPGSGDTFQIDTAIDAFRHGGWFGRGPGEGTVKQYLPDAHADFVFAVAAEEFGIVLCLILLTLFCFIVMRALIRAMKSEDPFARFASAGLAILFGAQSAINMAVNVSLIPAKGMTLPFISYGGSSIISLAYGMGMLIALTRERPRAELITSREAPALAPSAA
jgi:cell division protein FtsW